MKNKSFDCVEMKRKGAEAVYQKVASLSVEQQLEYWRKGSSSLRQTKSPRQIAFIFLDHRKKNFPIPEDIKVSVKFTSKSRNGRNTNSKMLG